MKINGKTFEGPAAEIIVFPMGESDIVFKAQCVTDYSEFEKIVKQPDPPMILHRGQEHTVPNFNDKTYKEKLNEYAKLQTQYMILKSLEATDNLEWETVDMSNPETWGNYEKELLAAGFSNIHIGRLIQTISSVNGLDEKKIEEAKKRFLATQSREAQE